MKKRITDVLGIDTLPNYWDKRYVKNLDKLSRPVYEVERHEDVWLTLRDGVRLCVDVYLPKGAGKVPALVSWSAYSKEMQNIKRGAIPPRVPPLRPLSGGRRHRLLCQAGLHLHHPRSPGHRQERGRVVRRVQPRGDAGHLRRHRVGRRTGLVR